MKEKLEGKDVVILKDDGCNPTVISRQYLKRNSGQFHTRSCSNTVTHTKEDCKEAFPSIFIDSLLRMVSQRYTSNCKISYFSHDVLLLIPCHKELKPTVDYQKPMFTFRGELLVLSDEIKEQENLIPIQISNIGIKKFFQMFKNYGGTMVFSVSLKI